MPRLRAEAGSRPGGRGTFLCFAKEKYPKERRPPVCNPFTERRGKPASSRLRGAPWNSLRCVAASFRHPRRVSSRSMGASTPTLTPQPPRRRRSQQGVDSRTTEQPEIPRAIALLGLACAALGACARDPGPSAAMARVDVLHPVPLWMRRGAQGLADQGSRVSERRAAARVERDPAKLEHRRLPRSEAQGTQTVGSPFLWFLSFGDAKERDSHAGRLPASVLNLGMPSTRHAAPCTNGECFKKHSYQRISH